MLLKKVVLLVLFLLYLVNLASAQYYYDYYNSGYGLGLFSFSGIDDILTIYELNSTWVDFFLFLTIFLGLTQSVFSEGHFQKQSKTISIGLSLALSFGMVLWERNKGINLLTIGPISFLLVSVLILYIIYTLLSRMTGEKWVAGIWTYIAGYIFLMIFGGEIFDSWNILPFGSFMPLLNLLFLIAIIVGIGGLIWGKENNTGHAGRGAP